MSTGDESHLLFYTIKLPHIKLSVVFSLSDLNNYFPWFPQMPSVENGHPPPNTHTHTQLVLQTLCEESYLADLVNLPNILSTQKVNIFVFVQFISRRLTSYWT
jgi:hypothetical protein